jgi:hypothetical protein
MDDRGSLLDGGRISLTGDGMATGVASRPAGALRRAKEGRPEVTVVVVMLAAVPECRDGTRISGSR